MDGSRRWPEHLDAVIEEFQACFDAMERYELLFSYSKRHPSPLPQEEWDDDNQVHGCQSRAHVICTVDESGGFLLRGGADAQIVQGLIAETAIAVTAIRPCTIWASAPPRSREPPLSSTVQITCALD